VYKLNKTYGLLNVHVI